MTHRQRSTINGKRETPVEKWGWFFRNHKRHCLQISSSLEAAVLHLVHMHRISQITDRRSNITDLKECFPPVVVSSIMFHYSNTPEQFWVKVNSPQSTAFNQRITGQTT